MRISKSKFSDICAEVSAQNVAEAVEIAKNNGSKDGGGKLGFGKLLMNAMFCRRIVGALGFGEDDNSEVEISKESFDKATQEVVATATEGAEGDMAIIMMMESIIFTSKLEDRLFGKETEG